MFNALVSNVDDHLRNHGFLWVGREGWRLAPAFDLYPTPVDVRERTLTTSIDLEDWTCDLALVLEVAPFFGLAGWASRSLIRSVADGVSAWRTVASALGAGRSEIDRVSSAFELDDARAASRLWPPAVGTRCQALARLTSARLDAFAQWPTTLAGMQHGDAAEG